MKSLQEYLNEKLIVENKVTDSLKKMLEKIIDDDKRNSDKIEIGVNSEALDLVYPKDESEKILDQVTRSISQKTVYPVYQKIVELAKPYIIEEVNPEFGQPAKNATAASFGLTERTHYVRLNCTGEEAAAIYEEALKEFDKIVTKAGSGKIQDRFWKTRRPGGYQYVREAEYAATKPETDWGNEESYYFYPCVWLWSPRKINALKNLE